MLCWHDHSPFIGHLEPGSLDSKSTVPPTPPALHLSLCPFSLLCTLIQALFVIVLGVFKKSLIVSYSLVHNDFSAQDLLCAKLYFKAEQIFIKATTSHNNRRCCYHSHYTDETTGAQRG